MRRLLILLIMSLMIVPINVAQAGCDIELEDTILQLIRAQRAADSGDRLTATSMLQAVQNDIDNIVNGCDTIQLGNQYTSPDESVSFSYPDGWTVQTIDDNLYAALSSPTLMNLFENDIPENMADGEAAIIVQIQPLRGETFDEVFKDIQGDLFDEFATIGQLEEETIQGRRHIKVSVNLNENVSGRLGFVDFSDSDNPAAVFILGVANRKGLPVLKVYTDMLRQSLQYPPVDSLRTPGVSLDTLSYSDSVDLRSNVIDSGSHMILSPDGTRIAYEGESELCVYEIETESQDCTPIPEDFHGRIRLLQWSPDGRYIAFQEDALRLFVDADVWLYNVEENAISDLTDDGDAEFGLGELKSDVWMDTTLTWGPDNLIYLLRTSFEAGGDMDSATYELLKIDPDSGDISQIQDLTGQFELFPIFYMPSYSLDGVMAVSPDATQMVVSVNEQNMDSPKNGLWLLDLQGHDEPQKIASVNDFKGGYAADTLDKGMRVIESIVWDADATGVYVYVTSPVSPLYFPMTYHMNLDSGEIVPMADLSTYSEDELMSLDDQDIPPMALMLRNPVLAPDFSGIIGIAGPNPETFVTAIPFDGEPGEPMILYRAEDVAFTGDSSTVGMDGTLILLGRLFRPD